MSGGHRLCDDRSGLEKRYAVHQGKNKLPDLQRAGGHAKKPHEALIK